MKKRTALLLSVIMLVNVLSGLSINAATTWDFASAYSYQLATKGLSGETGLVEKDTLGGEEAGVKWDMANDGVYTLTYFVEKLSETGNVTNKIELEFDKKSSGHIDFKAVVSKANESGGFDPQTTTYSYQEYDGNWKWRTITDSEFTFDKLSLSTLDAAVGFQNQQLNLRAGSLPIRILIKNQMIQVNTEGILPGNITEFTLNYRDKMDPTISNSAVLEILKGLKGFTVTPTHRKAGTLENKSLIYANDAEKLGEKPGVKVNFNKPKRVDASGQFVGVDGADIHATLDLWVSTSPNGTGSSNEASNSITLKFDLGSSNTSITHIGSATGGSVQYETSDEISIYVSKDNTDNVGNVVQWTGLDASMLIGASLTLNGGPLQSLPNAQKNFNPSNTGHTYLKYSVFRANEEQIGIKIIPYNVNGAVTYSLKQGSEPDVLTYLMNHNYPNAVDKKEPIYMYLPDLGALKYYQVEANIGTSTYLQSQIKEFKFNDELAPPTVPIIKSIGNIYAVPGVKTEGSSSVVQPQAVGFDIEWSAPSSNEIRKQLITKDDALYYELSLHRKPKNNRVSSDTDIIKLFKVTKVNDDLKVEMADFSKGSLQWVPGGHYEEEKNVFVAQDLVVKDVDKGWQALNVDDNRFNEEDYPEDKTSIDTIEHYYVPGIYYVSINSIYDPEKKGQEIRESGDSSDAAIAFDNVVEIVSTPSKFSHQNLSTINDITQSVEIEIDKVNLKKYMRNMLKPIGVSLTPDDMAALTGTYEIFLYQENSKKKEYADTDFKEALKDTSSIVNITMDSVLQLNEKQLEKLREGGILPITYKIDSLAGGSQGVKLNIQGLDSNQVYYVKARTRLDLFKDGKALETEPNRWSIFSKTYSFTTLTAVKPPRPDEKVPPAPESFYLHSQPNNTTAVLKWGKANFETDEEVSKVYYELARLTETEFKENQRSNKKSIQDLIKNNDDILGFNTAEANIRKLDSKHLPNDWKELNPKQISDGFTLEDMELTPNTIYYYYIRTVCIIEGMEVRSEWLMVPVTTSPVERPIKLQVENSKNYKYDSKTETVVSFLAPIPSDAKIPEDYDFEIAVKGESQEDYRLDYKKEKLTSHLEVSEISKGYSHYVYRIYDLKPSSRYDIKVRIVDKTKEAENNEYPRSLYSERVIVRTEYDEDSAEKDEIYDEYLDKFEQEVEKLRRRPYWISQGDNKYCKVYKYREAYAEAEMAMQSTYTLVTDEEANKVTYYLPPHLLDALSDSQTTINVELGTTTVSIRPYTLTEENEDLKDALKEIERKKAKDYYIKLDVANYTANGTVKGEETVSPEIFVDMQIVLIEDEDVIVEADIMDELNELIEDEKKVFIEKIENAIEKGYDKAKFSEDDLQEIIDKCIDNIKSAHEKKVKNILKDTTYSKDTIFDIEKAIRIASEIDSFAVNGYYSDNFSWTKVDVLQAAGGFAIETMKLGSYVFTGQASLILTVPELAPYQSIISKYGLTEFFKLDSYMIYTGATKAQVYGALAKVMGASSGTDYVGFLKAKGIKGVNSIGMNNTIRQDEAIYIIMQGYEKIYNRSIGSINITNKQSVKNIGAFQVPYRPYVYAAVELKIVSASNNNVMPSKPMTVKEIITMLSKVANK